MNTPIVVGERTVIATVGRYGSNGYGFAKNPVGGSPIFFHINSGRLIVEGNADLPVFTDREVVREPRPGDQLIIEITSTMAGTSAVRWGYYQEFVDAQGIIALRERPKCPPPVEIPIAAKRISHGEWIKRYNDRYRLLRNICAA